MSTCKSLILALGVCAQLLLTAAAWADTPNESGIERGRAVYNYYCYQCHAYSGNADTVAAQYLNPPPRNFQTTPIEDLSRERMVQAVTEGRPGTGMVSFAGTMDQQAIEDVVDYIRQELMSLSNREARYHTPENGWLDHDRYRDAYPFVRGLIKLSTPWEQLSEGQKRGRQLFLEACISCHDNGTDDELMWEISAASYPRQHYSHKTGYIDGLSGASVHAQHEVPVNKTGLSDTAVHGRQLFLDNCAFCHAPDGTGKNWIGSFMEPRPRDFTNEDFKRRMTREHLTAVVNNGLVGTSMPAWKNVFNEQQIESVVSFLLEAFAEID